METPASVQPVAIHDSVLSPLREPLFRSLWIAAVISYTGSWMQNVATGWLMTSLTQLSDVGCPGAGSSELARAVDRVAGRSAGGYF